MLAERDLLRSTGVFAPEAARTAMQRIDSVESLHGDESLLLLSLAGASEKLPANFAGTGAASSVHFGASDSRKDGAAAPENPAFKIH